MSSRSTVRMTTALAMAAAALVVAAAPSHAADACRPAAEVADRYSPINVQFDTGSTVVKPDDQKRIAEMASIAKSSKIQQICLRGFADKQGNADMNKKLSQARAEAVAAELGRHGIGRDMIAIASAGEPGGSLFPDRQDKSEADRRVEVRIVR